MLKEKSNDYWDKDSQYSHWTNYYIPFYKDMLGEVLDLEKDKLTYDSKRVVAKAKKGIDKIGGYIFGGDVIINIKNMPDVYKAYFDHDSKYNECNLGIMPKEGNLQGAKKRIGNDWRFDLFLKAINRYYIDGDNTIIEQAKKRNNSDYTRNVLNFFSNKIASIADADRTDVDPKEKIYNFTGSLYGISREMTDRFLECDENISAQDFYILIKDFWNERDINRLQKNKKGV